MPTHRTLFTILSSAMLGLSAPVVAQERSTISGSYLDAAVAAQPAGPRDAVRSFLASDQVREVAGRMGIDAATLDARVASLDDAALAQLPIPSSDEQEQGEPLAGGQRYIVISTTAVIVALLLILLLTD